MTIKELYSASNGGIFNDFYHPFLSSFHVLPSVDVVNPETGETETVLLTDDDPMFLKCRELYDQMLYPNILLNCGFFDCVYASVEEMAEAVRIWSHSRAGVWSDLLRTTVQKYNLLHNTDKTEEHEDTNIVKESGSNTAESNSENSVSAFDSNEYAPRDKTVGNGSGSTRRNVEATSTHKIKMYGNIGVTTSQQMLQEERKLVQFNIIDYIVSDFKKNFCIAVY